MTRYHYIGGCHCQNITCTLSTHFVLTDVSPRACDCDFCQLHGAMYISDPAGELQLRIKDPQRINAYRHGDQLAEFLLCSICGVLTCVGYTHDGHRYATVNARILKDATTGYPPAFTSATTASPRQLSAEEKTSRWLKRWFSQVSIEHQTTISGCDTQP